MPPNRPATDTPTPLKRSRTRGTLENLQRKAQQKKRQKEKLYQRSFFFYHFTPRFMAVSCDKYMAKAFEVHPMRSD